ncbi:MAG: hypothetical protein ACTSWN_16940 [Promethearchaeota archaeon]
MRIAGCALLKDFASVWVDFEAKKKKMFLYMSLFIKSLEYFDKQKLMEMMLHEIPLFEKWDESLLRISDMNKDLCENCGKFIADGEFCKHHGITVGPIWEACGYFNGYENKEYACRDCIYLGNESYSRGYCLLFHKSLKRRPDSPACAYFELTAGAVPTKVVVAPSSNVVQPGSSELGGAEVKAASKYAGKARKTLPKGYRNARCEICMHYTGKDVLHCPVKGGKEIPTKDGRICELLEFLIPPTAGGYCPVCKNSKKCTKCDGLGKIKCPECKGTEYVTIDHRKVGHGFFGTGNKIPNDIELKKLRDRDVYYCPRCKGAKYIANCDTGNQTGVCSYCNGMASFFKNCSPILISYQSGSVFSGFLFPDFLWNYHE